MPYSRGNDSPHIAHHRHTLTYLTLGVYHPITFTQSLRSPPASLFLRVWFLFVCSDSTREWDHTAFVIVWLSSLSAMPSSSIHVVTTGRIAFLNSWVILCCRCSWLSVYVNSSSLESTNHGSKKNFILKLCSCRHVLCRQAYNSCVSDEHAQTFFSSSFPNNTV